MSTLDALPCWVVIQGQVPKPTAYAPIQPPRRELGHSKIDVPDGTGFVPMTYANARDFCDDLYGYKTLCIVPREGLQAIWLDGLALDKAQVEIGTQLVGMIFCSADDEGMLLIGFGEPFADIVSADCAASCMGKFAFPIGRQWDVPERLRRYPRLSVEPNLVLHNHIAETWRDEPISKLDDIKPIADFLRGLNLTQADRKHFQFDEAKRKEDNFFAQLETEVYWLEKQSTTTARELLP